MFQGQLGRQGQSSVPSLQQPGEFLDRAGADAAERVVDHRLQFGWQRRGRGDRAGAAGHVELTLHLNVPAGRLVRMLLPDPIEDVLVQLVERTQPPSWSRSAFPVAKPSTRAEVTPTAAGCGRQRAGLLRTRTPSRSTR